MMMMEMDFKRLITSRCTSVDASGIRRIFEMATTLRDPINLSIGQPDFDVPEPIKDAAIKAIRDGRNKYTMTQGIPALRQALARKLQAEIGWKIEAPGSSYRDDDPGVMVTSGTSGGLILAYLALAEPGDQVIISDPYFVIYPVAATMMGAQAVYCDTYPDFRMTAQRIEPLITDRTKFVLLNTPSNPCGVVLTDGELRDIVTLCESRGVMLVCDEVYDKFTYPDGLDDSGFPTAARHSRNVLLLRGFSKTYGMTGWRLGYAAGPRRIIEEMSKMQQYSFVCAPSVAQEAGATALGVDMSAQVEAFAHKRDIVVDAFSGVTEVSRPSGAFYAFVQVPEHLGMSGDEFVAAAIERNVLLIPGGAFSRRDTHFRLSFATADDRLRQGLKILVEMMSR